MNNRRASNGFSGVVSEVCTHRFIHTVLCNKIIRFPQITFSSLFFINQSKKVLFLEKQSFPNGNDGSTCAEELPAR